MKYKMLHNDTTFIHEKFNHYIKQYKVMEKHSTILVAISGGQDSLCLLKLLKDQQIIYNWIIHVVHFNHKWRKDSKNNSKFIAKLAKKWNFFFT